MTQREQERRETAGDSSFAAPIPTQGCALFGAYRAAVGVTDGAVIVHSVTGCNYGTLRMHMQSRLDDVRQLSTVIYEEDLIFGNRDKLEEAIGYALEAYKPAVLFVIAGCIPEIVGDDLDGWMGGIASEVPVILVRAPGFKGSYTQGLLDVIAKLVDYMEPATPATPEPRSVNLVGLCSDDLRVDNDLAALRALLALPSAGITLNAVIPYGSFEELQRVPRAALNVVFPGFEPVGKLLLERFGTPYKVLAYPYGLHATSAFVQELAQAFGLDVAAQIREQEDTILSKLLSVKSYVGHPRQQSCAVIGNNPFACSLEEMLSKELGMNVMLFETSEHKDFVAIEAAIKKSRCKLIFGDSFSRGIAETLGIPHITFCYPVVDRIDISPKTYVGYTGLLYLLEDIINAR
jgi:nitrogenase molybdenum-iron protein beta chain